MVYPRPIVAYHVSPMREPGRGFCGSPSGLRDCRVLSLEKTVVSTCRDPVVRPSFMRRAVVVYLCGC